MHAACLPLLLAITPVINQEAFPHGQVEWIEHNLVYDDEGKLAMQQFIFWDWDPRESRYSVAGWVFTGPKYRTTLSKTRDGWVVCWNNESRGKPWQVYGSRLSRTHTQYDREAQDRQYRSVYQRRPLVGHTGHPSYQASVPVSDNWWYWYPGKD